MILVQSSALQYKKAQRSAESFSRSITLEKTQTFFFNINIQVHSFR